MENILPLRKEDTTETTTRTRTATTERNSKDIQKTVIVNVISMFAIYEKLCPNIHSSFIGPVRKQLQQRWLDRSCACCRRRRRRQRRHR